MEHFLRKNAKNVTHSDEVHREKLQKKVTILHILSSKLVVPTAKFANNVINFRKRLANLQTITRKFEDNVAVPNPRSILFFYLPVSALINFLSGNLKRAAQNSTEVSSLKMLALNTNFLHYSQKVPMKVIAKST